VVGVIDYKVYKLVGKLLRRSRGNAENWWGYITEIGGELPEMN
jgi:hypothetical protein